LVKELAGHNSPHNEQPVVYVTKEISPELLISPKNRMRQETQ